MKKGFVFLIIISLIIPIAMSFSPAGQKINTLLHIAIIAVLLIISDRFFNWLAPKNQVTYSTQIWQSNCGRTHRYDNFSIQIELIDGEHIMMKYMRVTFLLEKPTKPHHYKLVDISSTDGLSVVGESNKRYSLVLNSQGCNEIVVESFENFAITSVCTKNTSD